MNFDTYGPLDIKIDAEISSRWKAQFWEDANYQYRAFLNDDDDLSTTIGCYAFGIMSKNPKIWYVGKALGKNGFRQEIFSSHKMDYYNEVISKTRGVPKMIVFPLIDESGNFSRNRTENKRNIEWLERTLMSFAFEKNTDLMNKKDLTIKRNVWVYGLLGKQSTGRPYPERKIVRQAFLG